MGLSNQQLMSLLLGVGEAGVGAATGNPMLVMGGAGTAMGGLSKSGSGGGMSGMGGGMPGGLSSLTSPMASGGLGGTPSKLASSGGMGLGGYAALVDPALAIGGIASGFLSGGGGLTGLEKKAAKAQIANIKAQTEFTKKRSYTNQFYRRMLGSLWNTDMKGHPLA